MSNAAGGLSILRVKNQIWADEVAGNLDKYRFSGVARKKPGMG